MNRGETIAGPDPSGIQASAHGSRSRLSRSLLGGGVDGNEELTSIAGLVLLLLFLVLGVTILRVRQLIWLHLFLGLLLLGPVLLKIASTGYRFLRYYSGNAIYVAKGPPRLALRGIGPIVVVSTIVVFVTGIVLLYVGPRNRSVLLLIHKVSFIVWVVFMALHVLGHLADMGRPLRAAFTGGSRPALSSAGSGAGSGGAGRWLALVSAMVGGVVLALVLIPHFGLWTAPGAFPHHHHEFH